MFSAIPKGDDACSRAGFPKIPHQLVPDVLRAALVVVAAGEQRKRGQRGRAAGRDA
jgi:hypothetical protein